MGKDLLQFGLDVPETVPAGHLLGRTVNHERSINRYGRQLTDLITRHYNIGDELGYAAYKALRNVDGPKGTGQRMYDQAIAEGIDSVEGAPQELVDLFKQVDTVPDWVDWDQLHRGSVAYWRSGKLVVMALAYAAIGAGFRTYGGSRELVMSRRLIDRDQVGRRLIETLRWAANASKPGGMRRHEDGFRMTMKVRWVHGAVRYHASRNQHWDWDDWGVSVDNASAVYTMGTLFTKQVIEALEKVGVKVTLQEKEDMTALWRYIGHIMGIPDEVNFTSWNDLRRKAAVIGTLEHPADDGCRALMRSLIDYICEEEIEGYVVLPPAVDARLDPEQKKRLTYGLIRGWAGDEICEQLDVPDTRLRHLVGAAKPFIWTIDRVTRLRGRDDEALARAALEEFGVAIRLAEGDPEVAEADDVVERFSANAPRYRELTHA